jgi:hypothetical protein
MFPVSYGLGVISQKKALFIVTAVKISHLTNYRPFSRQRGHPIL